MKIAGVVMDLDGTLIDAPLDFELIRTSLGMLPGAPILEAIAAEPPERQIQCHRILLDHEWAAARNSSLIPGVADFFSLLKFRGIKTAIFTRNARDIAAFSLQKHGLRVDQIVAREDAPPKPDPAGLERIRLDWGLSHQELIYLGDYRFDLEAGRRAGIATWLFVPGEIPPFAAEAPFMYQNYAELGQRLSLKP